jgi:hypothetical protein
VPEEDHRDLFQEHLPIRLFIAIVM